MGMFPLAVCGAGSVAYAKAKGQLDEAPLYSRRCFAITGLPRSRTAWLSCLFTYGNVNCYHDFIGDYLLGRATVQELMQRLKDCPSPVVGIADSCYGPIAHKVRLHFPMVREVVIERPKADVLASVRRMMPEWTIQTCEQAVAGLEEALEKFVLNREVRRVSYAKLDDLATLAELWEFCTDGEPFPVEHAKKMLTMHVQLTKGHLMQVHQHVTKEHGQGP